MKTILDVYEEYKVMSNLQLHMLRVASVASKICDHMSVPIDKKSIITAGLLHDMANIIKADLNYFPQWNEPEGIEYWQNIKNEYIKNYGENEHVATLKIMKELGMSHKIMSYVDDIRFSRFCEQCEIKDFNIKIIHYADTRVDPYGVVSFNERMNEAGKRYKNHKNKVEGKQRLKFIACGKEIEKQIFAECKIKPEDITDESIAPIMEELKGFVILE